MIDLQKALEIAKIHACPVALEPMQWDTIMLDCELMAKALIEHCSSEADQRDAARYRWMRDHDMSGAYDEYTSGNLNGHGVDPLDSTIDAAMSAPEAPHSEGE